VGDVAVGGGSTYDGTTAEVLAKLVGAPRVAVYGEVASTMDVAHALAVEGAPAGTMVLADAQTAGRGRLGRTWQSQPDRGIWLTLIERPRDDDALEVLSLRLGIAAAGVLDAFAGEPVRLKWPNDLHLHRGKLAGILVEARWRENRPEWLAVGFGLNVAPPDGVDAAGLLPGTRRLDVLAPLVPALHASCNMAGSLDAEELRAFEARDLARGRGCAEPVEGRVRGVSARGELLVDTTRGPRSFRTGSLILTTDQGGAP